MNFGLENDFQYCYPAIPIDPKVKDELEVAMSEKTKVGTIRWIDLTVKDCARVRDFYQAVVGWDVDPVDMGGGKHVVAFPGLGIHPHQRFQPVGLNP